MTAPSSPMPRAERFPRAVLLDFDYTLGDSSPAIVECVHFALRELGRAPVAPEVIRGTIGRSLAEMWRHFTGDVEGVDAFIRLYRQHADRVMVAQTAIFPYVPAALIRLQRQGRTLGIVSSKHGQRLAAILEYHGLRAPFAVIVGGERVARPKPDPAPLHVALGELGCRPEQALYVGDSVVDAEAAQRAGVSFVAVASGVTPAAAFDPFPSWARLEHFGALPELLEEYDDGTGQRSGS